MPNWSDDGDDCPPDNRGKVFLPCSLCGGLTLLHNGEPCPRCMPVSDADVEAYLNGKPPPVSAVDLEVLRECRLWMMKAYQLLSFPQSENASLEHAAELDSAGEDHPGLIRRLDTLLTQLAKSPDRGSSAPPNEASP